ncbi:MAG: hypothetical protein KJO55_02185 [Gammaproteobacteria bacterium]|nr:hypothetical protein [Gammaproteobacteria bacterium]
MRVITLMLMLCMTWGAAQAELWINFESGPVRPLAMSPDGSRLYAVNTPDNTLEIFDIASAGLQWLASVPVGLEPVAVALRNNDEVWVVNHLSDSISVVDAGATPRVVRTLLTGDEPRDIVFAGSGNDELAFITTAHRGQHRTHPSISAVPGAGDPQLSTAGVGRADVWVYDATNPGNTIGGTPVKIIELFGDTPRALAVTPDGSTVYAAVFHSGNQTAVVSEGMVCNGFDNTPCNGDGMVSPNGLPGGQVPGGNPGPAASVHGVPAPEVGLIVKYDNASGEWRDELGRNWSNGIRFNVPDLDVFAIDTGTLNSSVSYAQVGTVLFNMIVNPADGSLYVANTESRNEVRFEGPGGGGSTVQGNLAQARITIIDGNSVSARHLNKHIDYSVTPAPAGTADHSIATPLDMAVSSDGMTLYVAGFGSGNIGVFNTSELDDDTFDPTQSSAGYLTPTGGGPAGLVLDESRNRLYALTRFDNAVSMFDLDDGSESGHYSLHNPEPVYVRNGRPFLYDARLTSSNGEASCASCHIFGDMDSLAWDLGNPDGELKSSPLEINLETIAVALNQTSPTINGTGDIRDLHPMKGPMTTQTLRGMLNSGAMHWRGDRAVGEFGTSATDALLSFLNFNEAFPGLVGRASSLSPANMMLFADFALTLTLPPNPVRGIDNSLSASEQAGRDLYFGPRRMDGSPVDIFGDPNGDGFTCEGCHRLDAAQGFFGTGKHASFEDEEQTMKIPHLRNMYQKVGMFGMPAVEFFNSGNNTHAGDQVRATGFLHDGSTDTLFRFFQATVFNQNVTPFGTTGFFNDTERADMEAFMFAFDTDLAPVVGQQITLAFDSPQVIEDRVDLLLQRAATPFVSQILGGAVTEADIVVSGRIGNVARSWVRLADGTFQSDSANETPLSATALKQLAQTAGQELTFTAVVPGTGVRIGIDRDSDGIYNSDDVCPAVSDAGQADSDADGYGDACDNCILDANTDQHDSNNDGFGNRCDADLDNDGQVNFVDLTIMKQTFFSNDADADLDNSGSVNFADLTIMKNGFFGTPGPSAYQ